MYNDLFTIGPFTVHGYGLMIATGVLFAVFMTERLAKIKGVFSEQVFDMAVVVILGGIAGAKILYLLTIIPEIIKNPSILLDIMDGWVIYGAVIGGTLAMYLYCRKHQMPFLKLADCVMPCVAGAQGFGRLGCLLAGCCYGIHYDGFPHLVFTNSSYAPNGVALFATQPLSSLLNFAHFAILLFIFRKAKKDGTVVASYLLFYSIGRFIIEFFRGDLERGAVGPLSTSQFISLLVFAGAVMFLLIRRSRETKTGAEI